MGEISFGAPLCASGNYGHPEYANDALASLTFLHWLQQNKPDLVDFPLMPGEERSQVVNGWLKAAGYVA